MVQGVDCQLVIVNSAFIISLAHFGKKKEG